MTMKLLNDHRSRRSRSSGQLMRDTPGPKPILPLIMPPASVSGHAESPASAGDRLWWGRISRGGGTIRFWIVTVGAVAAAIPAGPGIARTVEGRPGALPLLVLAAVVAIVTVALNTAAVMYQARQETLRKEIEYRSADTLAAAMARCIDDAHAKAKNLPAARELEEASQVRASARQLLTDVMPCIAASLERDPRSAAARSRGGHEPPGRR